MHLIISMFHVRQLLIELATYLYRKLNAFGQAKEDYKCIVVNFSF